MSSALYIIIGAIIAGIARLGVQLYSDGSKKRAMAAGLAAELARFFESEKNRGYAQKYRDYRDKWRECKGKIGKFPELHFYSIEHAERFPVYDSVVGNIGNLGPKLTRQIVKVYSTIISIRHGLCRIEKDTPSGERISKDDYNNLCEIIKDWEATLEDWDAFSESLEKKSKWIAWHLIRRNVWQFTKMILLKGLDVYQMVLGKVISVGAISLDYLNTRVFQKIPGVVSRLKNRHRIGSTTLPIGDDEDSKRKENG